MVALAVRTLKTCPRCLCLRSGTADTGFDIDNLEFKFVTRNLRALDE